MLAYLIGFGLSGLFLLLGKMVERDEAALGSRARIVSGVFLGGAILSITLLVGLRGYDVGTDSVRYVENLSHVASGQFRIFDWQSPLYYLITLLVVKVFGGSYTALFLICGFIVAFFLCVGLWKSSQMPWLGLFIVCAFGYCFEAVNQIRQFIAVCIVLYSYVFIKSGRVKRFVAFCVVAMGFHVSACVALLIPFVYKKDFKATRILALLVALVLLVALFPVVHRLLAFVPFYGEWYIGTALEYDATVTTVFNCVIRVGVFVFLLAMRGRVERFYPDYAFLLNILLVGVVFQVITVLSVSFGRIPTYFMVFLAYAVPELVQGFDRRESKRVCAVVSVLFFSGLLIGNLMLKDYSDYEYELFWDSDIKTLA